MHPMVFLGLAIVCEVVGTAALKASEGFTRPLPALLVLAGYGASFYFFSRSLQYIPLGIAYAIWAGLGTVGTVVLGMIIWHEVVTIPRVLGILLIVGGVVLINLFDPAAAPAN